MHRSGVGRLHVDFDFSQIDSAINARSLAIVGASGAPMKFGSMFTKSQLDMGFRGPVYLVNPKESEIMGRAAYPDLRSLPEVPELVYLMIPAHRSIEVLRECADLRVRAVIMVASGFREIGESGVELEREALTLAREGGFRIVGPNCFGIYNPRNRLTVLPGYDFSVEAGNIAFISQSGGFCVHVARQCQSQGLRFSAVVSFGNAADIDETDLLRYFTLDPQTEIIAGYLEGAKRGREFALALKEAASSKPVVMWKVGRAEASRRAVLSHTGSLAGSAEVWSSLLKQCGVIQASGVDEVCDVLLALKHIGAGPGKRVLLAGGGGGLGTYGADIAWCEGLEVPPLDEDTHGRMSEVLSGAGAVAGNPLDIGAPLVMPDMLEQAIGLAASNPTTDILVFDMAVNFAHDIAGEPGLELATDIFIKAAHESGKPMAVVMYSRSSDHDDLKFEEVLRRYAWKLLEAGVPVFPSMPRALRAISLVN